MEPLIIKTHKLLIERKKTIAVAESCTAGLLSQLLTQRSGSSQYFLSGVITYSNKAKERLLSIPAAILAEHGAVSKIVAVKMAESVRLRARSDYGVGITGIAGPTGGTPAKPVGTVFIAVSSKKRLICKRFKFQGSRSRIRTQSALKALELINRILKLSDLRSPLRTSRTNIYDLAGLREAEKD